MLTRVEQTHIKYHSISQSQLHMLTFNYLINPALFKNANYNTVSDTVPVVALGTISKCRLPRVHANFDDKTAN